MLSLSARSGSWLLATIALVSQGTAQTHIRGYRGGRFDTRLNEETFEAVGAGAYFTLFLRADGSITGVGSNHVRQLDYPAPPPGLSYLTSVGGDMYSMALRSDGEILVRSTLFSRLRDVPTLPAGVTFVALEGGFEHVVALRSDGGLESWGWNDYGQTDVPALPSGLTCVAASAGSNHSLALRSDGQVIAFGSNSLGQCDVPTLAAGLQWIEVAAGASFSLGLVSDGSLRAWGRITNVPSAPPGSTFVEVEAGSSAYARLDSGEAIGWSGPFDVHAFPLPPGRSVVQIAPGGSHAVALLDDGHVAFEGYLEFSESNCPPAPAGVSYRQISHGAYHGLLLLGDGTLRAWGSNSDGQCNIPPLPNGLVYTRVATALDHSVALRNDGSVVNFGQYFGGLPRPPAGRRYVELAAGHEAVLGLLDDGRLQAYLSAPPTLPVGLTYTKIAAGYDHELALRSDGALVAWGRNLEGQCDVPSLPAGVTYVQVDGGQLHTVALRSDGAMIAFGDNAYGQCDVPALPSGVTYVEVAAGDFSSIARRSDGSFVTFGHNSSGQNDLPALAPGEVIRSFDGDGNFVIEQAAASGAPDLVQVVPEIVPLLSPGLAQDLFVFGAGFAGLSGLALDGVPLDPARYTVLNDGTLQVDLPELASRGAHDLAATDGVHTDTLELTVAVPLTPKLEFESGEPLVVVDRDDGLTFRLSGPIGVAQQLYFSSSNVPSTSPFASLALGNGFTELLKGPRYATPSNGLLEVYVPPELLPVPPPSGLTYYVQTLQLRFPPPFQASNLQSFVLVP